MACGGRWRVNRIESVEHKINPTLRALLRANFLAFAQKALREVDGVRLGDEPYLQYLADELEKFATGDTRRLVINLPPGHLKTSLGSVCGAAWLLAQDPTLKIIVVSHAEHLSKAIARKIRTILQSAWYREIFTTRVKKGHAEITDFGTTSGGGVFVTSFQAGFTGRRADVIVVDDPHDIRDDIERIAATIETFSTVLMSRLNDRKQGRVLVIAHRVHERDLSAYLQQKPSWRHVILPLIAIKDQSYETSAGVWRRRRGGLLRPDSLSLDDIDDMRVNSFNPDFGMLYQQDAESQGLPAITADCFPVISETLSIRGSIVLSVDPGVSNRRTSAYSVIQAWILTPDRYVLFDQFRDQIDFSGLRDAIRRFRRRYQPVAILVERAANGHALISDLTRRYGHLVRPIDPYCRSKAARLRVHAADILSGVFAFLPKRLGASNLCGSFANSRRASSRIKSTLQHSCLTMPVNLLAWRRSRTASEQLPPVRRGRPLIRPRREDGSGGSRSPLVTGGRLALGRSAVR